MKSKIVEAMMYGKKILGTKFSFIGYEKVKSKIGIECNDKYSFIKEINKMEKNKKNIFSILENYMKLIIHLKHQ